MVSGWQFEVEPSASPLDAALYYQGIYEAGTLWMIERLLQSGDVFFDIGAYIGLMSLHASRAVGSDGLVHAFEPHPDRVRRLRSTLATNHVENVRVHPFAVGHHGEGRLSDGTFKTLLDVGAEVTYPVDIRSLDELVLELGLPNMVKIDVEGWESEVVASGTQILSATNAPALCVEIMPENSQVIDAVVRLNKDYRPYRLARGKETRSKLIEVSALRHLDNVFFLRPPHLDLVM